MHEKLYRNHYGVEKKRRHLENEEKVNSRLWSYYKIVNCPEHIPDSNRKYRSLYASVINASRATPHSKWVTNHHHHHHSSSSATVHFWKSFTKWAWTVGRWAIAAYAHHGHALIWFAVNRFCIVPPSLRGRPPLHNSWTSRSICVSLFIVEDLAITHKVSRARENP